MSKKQVNAILKMFNVTLDKGLYVAEEEDIFTILKKCEKNGQFYFDGDSYWCFIQSEFNKQKCIRMIFALKYSDGGKVKKIERLTSLIYNLERALLYVDKVSVDDESQTNFVYIDAIKILRGNK